MSKNESFITDEEAEQQWGIVNDTQTDFDKQLDDILLRHGAEQGELHHSLKEAFKAAVDKYVIGKDEDDRYENKENHVVQSWEKAVSAEDRNNLKAEQRLALWGDK